MVCLDFPHIVLFQLLSRHARRHFNEIVAAGYRPGYFPSEGAVSVSIPVSTLATLVPPRALVAWDKRLLSRNQYFTLYILSNKRTQYPFAIHTDGSGGSLQASPISFRVGLTDTYKPQWAQCDSEPILTNHDSVGTGMGDFDIRRSLEHAMNEIFLPTLRIRTAPTGTRWAGAETLHFALATSTSESSMDEVAQDMREVRANNYFGQKSGMLTSRMCWHGVGRISSARIGKKLSC